MKKRATKKVKTRTDDGDASTWASHLPVLCGVLQALAVDSFKWEGNGAQLPTCIEFGCGIFSTPVIEAMTCQSVHHEHNETWAKRVQRMVRRPVLVSPGVPDISGDWDVAFIDNGPSIADRVPMAGAVKPHVETMIVHDGPRFMKHVDESGSHCLRGWAGSWVLYPRRPATLVVTSSPAVVVWCDRMSREWA